MKNIKRITSLLLSTLLIFSMVGCSSKDIKGEQKAFDKFLNNDFVESMESDYISSHVYLENPEKFGVETDDIDVIVGEEITDKVMKDARADLKKTKKAFEEFDRDLLTADQKDSYDIYEFMLETAIEKNASKYDYMASLFESSSGIHTQLPIIFADFTLRNEEDLKEVIQLMNSTKAYVNSVLKYTKKQMDKGTLMLDINSVKEYCQNILDNKETSGVMKGLLASIDELKLGEDLTRKYGMELKTAFDESFIPAYEDIVKTMGELDASKNNTKGLSYLKNGKDYYELLFRDAIGSDKSIKSVKADLNALMESSLYSAQSIVMKNEQAYMDLMNGDVKTSYTDFESILRDLNEDVKKDFPAVDELNYRIAPLSDDLATSGIAAYFNLPAIDGTTPKQIRVNMSAAGGTVVIDSLSTFSTVAHEGLPGHMYQVAYAYENMSNPWRKVVAGSMGYQEGYASYMELYATKYLDDVSKDAIQINNDLTVIQNCLTALSDIGIHYEGWTKKQLKQFLISNGLEVPEVDVFYEQLQSNPTSFLSYYVGYMQFVELKDKAQEALGDEFEDKAFHKAILKSGIAPFNVVERNVEAYIKDKK